MTNTNFVSAYLRDAGLENMAHGLDEAVAQSRETTAALRADVKHARDLHLKAETALLESSRAEIEASEKLKAENAKLTSDNRDLLEIACDRDRLRHQAIALCDLIVELETIAEKVVLGIHVYDDPAARVAQLSKETFEEITARTKWLRAQV